MGVECDGATYHSSKSARERDRLRQEVLEGMQWHLHRIWSTDWFEDPQREAERLRKVILARLSELDVDQHYKEPIPEELGETVCIGDKVVVHYADEPDRHITIVLSNTMNDPSKGILHCEEPLGEAVLGSVRGAEIEIDIGNKIRTAIVEEIIKNPIITVH